jgi:sugar phosphate isomerase/epimerase
MIGEAGFECYFTRHYDLATVSEIKRAGDKLGLPCEFIHGPFFGINSMWIDDEGYHIIMDGMIEAIDTAAELGIPTVIAHTLSGWSAPEITDIGLERFDRLIEHAANKGVNIAFENLRKFGQLAYFCDRYEKNPAVGFCYDVGHENCYTKTVCWMDVFRDRTIAIHIHDNLGKSAPFAEHDDLHLLPFDGNTNFKRMIDKLDEYGCDKTLMLEVFSSRYPQMSAEEFIAAAYERATRISKL